MHSTVLPYAWVAAAGLFGGQRNRRASVDEVWQDFARSVEPPYDLEEFLMRALDAVSELLPAQGYYAYVGRAPGERLQLRITRATSGTPQIGINYAGLVAGAPIRQTPLDIPAEDEGIWCKVDGPKGEPHVSLGLGGMVILRAALAPKTRVPEPTRQLLLDFAGRLWPALRVMLELHAGRHAAETVALQASTQRLTTELTLQVGKLLALVCRLGGEALGAQAGYACVWDTSSEVRRIWELGEATALYDALAPPQVVAAQPSLRAAIWRAPQMPRAVSALGYAGYALIAISDGGRAGGAVAYGIRQEPQVSAHEKSVLASLEESLARALRGRLFADQLSKGYIDTLMAVVDLLDAADPLNADHSERVQRIAVDLAQELGVTTRERELVRLAAKLHDLGMVAINLDLPRTRGVLSASSREVIQQHPDVGAALLTGLPDEMVPTGVADAIRQHHERYDGLGYPLGLAGDAISLAGRILACAEVFVARTAARSYRPALSDPRALFELQRLSGSQLDPEVTQALLAVHARRGIRPQEPGD